MGVAASAGLADHGIPIRDELLLERPLGDEPT